MSIQVLGTNCPNCHSFYELVKQIKIELNLESEVEYINDFAKIIERGVYTSPILVVNDKVLLKGSGHSREVIRSALTSLVITEKEKKIADCPYCLST